MEEILQYIENTDQPFKSQLEAIHARTLATGDVTHRMSYGMPCCYYKGKYLLGYAAFKQHVGLYPGPEAIEILRDELGPMASSKGTVKLPAGKPVDEDLVDKILEIGKARISA